MKLNYLGLAIALGPLLRELKVIRASLTDLSKFNRPHLNEANESLKFDDTSSDPDIPPIKSPSGRC